MLHVEAVGLHSKLVAETQKVTFMLFMLHWGFPVMNRSNLPSISMEKEKTNLRKKLNTLY